MEMIAAGMNSGMLRHRLTLQKRVETQDPVTGELTHTWTTVAEIWGKVEALSGREFISAQALQSKVTAKIRIRYRDDIDASMRISHRGKIYNIEAVLPDNISGLEWITLPCSEGVNDG